MLPRRLSVLVRPIGEQEGGEVRGDAFGWWKTRDAITARAFSEAREARVDPDDKMEADEDRM